MLAELRTVASSNQEIKNQGNDIFLEENSKSIFNERPWEASFNAQTRTKPDSSKAHMVSIAELLETSFC